MDKLKTKLFECLLMVHGTSRTNLNKILEDGKICGDKSPNWNVSQEWIYFWNSFTSISDIISNGFSSESIDEDLKTSILEEIESIHNCETTYDAAAPKILRLINSIDDDLKDDFAQEAIENMLSSASENASFALDGCNEALKSIIVLDGSKMSDIEVDHSCHNMDGAARVPAPVDLNNDSTIIGCVDQFSIGCDLSEVREAVLNLLYEIEADDYYTDEEAEEISQLMKGEDEDTIFESIDEIRATAIDRVLHLDQNSLMGIYCTSMKMSRMLDSRSNVITIEHDNNTDQISIRKKVAKMLLARTESIFVDDYFNDSEYLFTEVINIPKLKSYQSITK